MYLLYKLNNFEDYISISGISFLISSSNWTFLSQSFFIFYILTRNHFYIYAKGILYELINFPSIISNIYPKKNRSSASLFLLSPWFLSQRNNVSAFSGLGWEQPLQRSSHLSLPHPYNPHLPEELQDDGRHWVIFLRKINGAYSIIHTFWKNFLLFFFLNP